MNEIFAIDPRSPADIRDLKSMMDSFGFQTGRFIANFPYDWLMMLQSKAEGLPELDKARLSIVRNRIQSALLDIGVTSYDDRKDWEVNAKRIEALVNHVLAREFNSFGFTSLQSFLWDIDDSTHHASHGGHLACQADAYLRALNPLLQQSSEIFVIDRYFSTRYEDGRLNSLAYAMIKMIAERALSYKRLRRIFFLMDGNERRVGTSKQYSLYLQDLEEINKIFESSGVSVLARPVKEMIHGRYVISIKGGLHFDHGIKLGKGRNHIHWLSQAELSPIHEWVGL